jgi:radical SAM protein with 4Fe4S-binding SPASM domain
MKFPGNVSSVLNYLMQRLFVQSLWKSNRHHIPLILREIIKSTAMLIMKSDTREKQHLRRILEERIMILTVELTNICSANCQFCAYRHQKRERRIISDDLFKYAVCQFAESGGGVLNLTPIVGDPLLDKNLIPKVKYSRGMKEIEYIFFFTNLIELSDFDVNDLLSSGVDAINASVCIGDREMYSRVYGVDKYDSVMQNLESLLKENRKLGDQVKIEVHVKGEKPHERIRLSSDYRRISEIYGKHIVHIDETYDNWTGIIREDNLPKGHAFRELRERSEPCSELYNGIIVFTNGNVGICWRRDVEAKLVIGNIYESSLEDIWKGRGPHMMRENWLKGNIPLPCKRCYCYTPISDFLLANKSEILHMERKQSRQTQPEEAMVN